MTVKLDYIKIADVEILSGRKVDFQLSYQTFGQDYKNFPVVVINHSLTGNSNVSGENGWWNDLVGVDKLIDTNKYAIIAFNIPGNSFGEEVNDFLEDLVLGDVAKAFNKAIYELGISSCLLYTSPSPRDGLLSRMPSSA